MKIKELQFHKEMKVGLPSYSNITVGMGMTVELKEEETIDTSACWDKLNQELALQTQGIDPSWIGTAEYKNFFKTTIRVDKVKEGE
jgi:hypothetical protein